MEQINPYTIGYDDGYFKALSDIINFEERPNCYKEKGVRKYKLLISLIKHLLTNWESRDVFKQYGGEVGVWYKVSDDKKKNIIIDRIER